MIPAHYLSLSDLITDKYFAEAFGNKDVSKIEEWLYTVGLDVNQPYEEVVCQHRNLRGQIVECLTYRGSERVDKQWATSGCASFEASLFAGSESTLVEELTGMCKEGYSHVYEENSKEVEET